VTQQRENLQAKVLPELVEVINFRFDCDVLDSDLARRLPTASLVVVDQAKGTGQ